MLTLFLHFSIFQNIDKYTYRSGHTRGRDREVQSR